jgi:flagellar M-ring protein FliF
LLWTAYRLTAEDPGFLMAEAAGKLQLPYADSAADAGLGSMGDGSAAASAGGALEADLARSIAAIDRIDRARVHLVLPSGTAADGDAGMPSASVVIATAGSLPLGRAQVGAIQQLVATAVPGLRPQAVTVVDDKGNLLARGEGADGATAAAERSEQLRLAYEQRLARAIESLLSPSLGAGNVRAQVTASLDFDRLTETAEVYDPDGQVLRSSQSLEETSNAPDATSAGSAAGPVDSAPLSERNEESVDYALSRTTRTQVRQGGKLQRLSVAVMVNGSQGLGDDGTLQYRPRSSSEMAQIESLVRAAVGIDESRGDRLDVINLPFVEAESLRPMAEAPGFAGFSRPELLRLVEVLVLGAIAIAIVFFVARPLLARNLGPSATAAGPLPQESQIAAGYDDLAGSRDGAFALGAGFAGASDQGRNRIGEIVRAHPEAAVTVVRAWLQRER